MAQLIQAHNDSHIVSPGHAPNAPLIQASAPPPQQFRVTGDDPNARPDDRSVWNPQTNQWECGTAAIANQNARLADERRGQMAFEADMRRSLNTPIDVGALGGAGGGRMPTQGEVDAMFGNVRRGAERARASMGLPSSVLPSANGKKGSVTFTGGGNPAEAAPEDPFNRFNRVAGYIFNPDGSVRQGMEKAADKYNELITAEILKGFDIKDGASIVGGQNLEAPANPSMLGDKIKQSILNEAAGAAPGATAPGAAAPDAGAPARRGKFRIAKADGSYVIEGEGDTFTETKNGETTTGRLDDLPVGSVQVTQPAPKNPVETATPEVVAVPDNAATDTNAGETPKNAPATPEQAATPAQKAQSAKDEYGKLKNKLFPEGSWDATVRRDHEFEKAVRDVKQGSKLDMLLDPANAPDTSKALAERQAEQEEYLASDARWNAGANREYEKQIAKVQKRIEAATSFANEADNNPSMTTAQRKAAHDKVAEIQKELGDLEAQHLDFLQHIDKDPGWYARGERAKKRSGKDKK